MATDLESVLEGSVVTDMSRELGWPPIMEEESVESSGTTELLLSETSGSVLLVLRLLSEDPSDLVLTLTKETVLNFFIKYVLSKIKGDKARTSFLFFRLFEKCSHPPLSVCTYETNLSYLSFVVNERLPVTGASHCPA